MLPTGGLNTAHGHALVSISDSPTLRAALGSVLYLVLSALLSVGVAIAIRDTAGIDPGRARSAPPAHHPRPRRHRPAASAPAAIRPDDRRARHPSHHQAPRPTHRPPGWPRRPHRLGHRGSPYRRT